MKKFLIVAAAVAVLAPLTANAQERMSDARYLSAQRCLAYADLSQLQGDSSNFTGLRSAAEVGARQRSIAAQVRQDARGIRARATTLSVEELRIRRDEACASFSEVGLVHLGGSGS